MSGYIYFDEEKTHQCAEEYIDLIKKTLKKGGRVKYDSGDFLALDQHDRKRVTQSLLEYEHGFKVLDTLKVRIQKSEMSQADKDELVAMISPVVPEPITPEPPQVVVPEAVVLTNPEVKKSFLSRIFNIIKRA